MFRFARLAVVLLYGEILREDHLAGVVGNRNVCLMEPLTPAEWQAVYGPPTVDELRQEERESKSIAGTYHVDHHNLSVDLGSWEDG